MADCSVRAAAPGDVPAIVELLDRCLGGGKSREMFEWKHCRNPFGPSPCLVAESEGRIVALRAFLRWRWRTGGRVVEALRAVDTATDPAWRRRGLFTRLTRQLLSEVERAGAAFVFNTPGPASRAGYLRLGWRSVGRLPVLVRPLRASAVLRWVAPSGSRTAAPISTLPEVPELLAARELDPLIEEGRGARLVTDRSRRYLEWRYREVPGTEYRALWSPGAALICRSQLRRGLRELKVCELLARDEGPAAELLRDLGRRVEADYLVACAARRTTERRALRRCGFVPLPGLGPLLTARVLAGAPEGPSPLERDSWRPSLGDLEMF